ncbi:MAG: HEPN domain-containing protein, partial [Candidatus Methylomirabilales bacterium]
QAEEAGFASLREKAETLAPFAVEIRYPGEAMEISREEAREAFATAEAVWDSVLNLLPGESHPPLTEEVQND